MSKLKRRAILDDGCNPELVVNAVFNGVMDMPVIKAPKHIFIPEGIVPYSEWDKEYVKKKINPQNEAIGYFEKDEHFSDILINPDEQLNKICEFGAFITPDCSLYRSAPLPVQIINIYRNRVIGAYYQKKGIYVIPQVRWGNELTYTLNYFPERIAFLGIEKYGIVAIGPYGCIKTKEDKYYFEAGLYEMLQALEPKVVLVYGSLTKQIYDKYENLTQFILYPDWITRMHNQEGGNNNG